MNPVKPSHASGGAEWTAKAECPQCGGEVTLEVGDSVLACGFCRTRLYLATQGPLEYRLLHDPAHEEAARAGRLFHLPYWRLRGLRFTVRDDPPGVEAGLLDFTAPATPFLPAACTLGIRPQANRLFFSPSLATALAPEIAQNRALAIAQAEAAATPGFVLSRLIGEGRVVIHAPHLLEERGEGAALVEAFPDGQEFLLDAADAEKLKKALKTPKVQEGLKFLPLQCPECAGELPAESGAVALLCPKCAVAWLVEKGNFIRVPYEILGEMKEGERLFPFWSLAVRAEGMQLVNLADLARLAFPYRPAAKALEERPCALLVPAFKIAPNVFLRLSRTMTFLERHEIAEGARNGAALMRSEAVRLPVQEAAEALKVILCAMAVAKRKEFPKIAEARLKVERAKLVLIPFALQGTEWFHAASGQAIQATTVKYGNGI